MFIINYQTNFQKNHQQKDSNLLLQKRAREKKMTVIRIFNSKYIPPKYTAKTLKKEEANFIYQHYKGQEKLSKFIITKENQRKRCSKYSSK